MRNKQESGWLRLLVLKSGKSIARLFDKKQFKASKNNSDLDTFKKPQIGKTKEEIMKEIDNH